MSSDDEGIVELKDCDAALYEGQYCIKTTGVTGGGLFICFLFGCSAFLLKMLIDLIHLQIYFKLICIFILLL
jgi:hypothetical protein